MEGSGRHVCNFSNCLSKGGTARDMEGRWPGIVSTIGVPTVRCRDCVHTYWWSCIDRALAASLALKTNNEVNVPIDVMISWQRKFTHFCKK